MKGNSGLKDWWKESGSFFMFAEGVEDRPELLEKYGDLLVGSISFKINQTFQVRHLHVIYVYWNFCDVIKSEYNICYFRY